MEVSCFTRVVSLTGVSLLTGSADTRLTREAGQLAGQFRGPNRVKPSIIVWLTPHKFGTIWPGRMTCWLPCHPSPAGRSTLLEEERLGKLWLTVVGCGKTWRCTKANSCTLTASMAFSVWVRVACRAGVRISSLGMTGVKYGLSSGGSKASMSSVASFLACQAACSKRDCSSKLPPCNPWPVIWTSASDELQPRPPIQRYGQWQWISSGTSRQWIVLPCKPADTHRIECGLQHGNPA